MTQEELFEKYVHFYHLEENYVYLKEDNNGRYIEYVYKEGAPHDNRCLSWYEKPHSNYVKKHPNTIIKCKEPNTNVIYRLCEFNCGLQDKEGDEKCVAGCPSKKCMDSFAFNWTYEEPIKCACWYLEKCDLKFSVPSHDVENFSKFISL